LCEVVRGVAGDLVEEVHYTSLNNLSQIISGYFYLGSRFSSFHIVQWGKITLYEIIDEG